MAGNGTTGIAQAVSTAKGADAVVLFLGLDKTIENEASTLALTQTVITTLTLTLTLTLTTTLTPSGPSSFSISVL